MMTYATIETLHQIKYRQPFAMNILLFITMLSLLKIFNEHIFKKEKRNNKITKDMPLKILLDKIMNLEDLNL